MAGHLQHFGQLLIRMAASFNRVVQRIVRHLAHLHDREILRQRLIELVQAEQLAEHLTGHSEVKIREIDRLVDALVNDPASSYSPVPLPLPTCSELSASSLPQSSSRYTRDGVA
jgi:hypothetical protein